MNYFKCLFVIFLFSMTGISYGSSNVYGYFPPNNHGNYINLDYLFDNNSPGSNLWVINSRFKFDKMDTSPRGTKFVATQFGLSSYSPNVSGGGVMYIGVNPTQESQGYSGQAHFSYFGNSEGTSMSENCNKGADNGDGVTCAIDLHTYEGYTYNLNAVVLSTDQSKTVLAGFVEVFDEKGNSLGKKQIGEISVSQAYMVFSNPITWVEGTSDPCSQVNDTKITFYPLGVKNVNAKFGKDGIYQVPMSGPVNNACGVKTWSTPDGIGTTMEYPASQ